jgi:AcrR family transcriptional regulator
MGHREALLAGARQCLEEKGYARTTARDLVAASNTNLASIGYHFGSKEALLNEAIGQAFEEWTEHIVAVSVEAAADDPLEQAATSIRAMVEEFEGHRPLLLGFVEAVAQSERAPELRAQIARQYATARATIGDSVRDALGSRGQEVGADPEVIASFLCAVCDGLMLQWLVDPDATPTGEQVVTSVGAALFTLQEQISHPS